MDIAKLLKPQLLISEISVHKTFSTSCALMSLKFSGFTTNNVNKR